MATKQQPQHPSLSLLTSTKNHVFEEPSKKIYEGEDVTFFLTSKAYTDIMTFVLQLNLAMFPRRNLQPSSEPGNSVQNLKTMITGLDSIIEEAPPDTGPRRFGNVAFKQWYTIVENQVDHLLQVALTETPQEAQIELRAYLLGSFGSAQRLDYGSGHELSFLAFLGCIWKLGGFVDSETLAGQRTIVLDVIQPYLQLIRRLIKTYNLEPAGSHGVWGLDDHSFIPYIFGSAQLSPIIGVDGQVPTEGSSSEAPNPGDIAKFSVVEVQRKTNMYFDAVGFINDVKKGPFWEHSPMLYDISGVKAGWAKINKGMIKMYNAEVLSKFPVVQHFPFGSLFRWERDPDAIAPISSAHTSNQPTPPTASTRHHGPHFKPSQAGAGSSMPAASAPMTMNSGEHTSQGLPIAPTRAPWAKAEPTVEVNSSSTMPVPATRAPWAKDR